MGGTGDMGGNMARGLQCRSWRPDTRTRAPVGEVPSPTDGPGGGGIAQLTGVSIRHWTYTCKVATVAGDPEGRQRHSRHRNARGQGAHLAEEILAGALAIIDRTGSDGAVTLRSVAREVGIAAPSIYAHFADRDAVLWAAVGAVFDQVGSVVEQAVADHEDPVERLVTGCQAYVAYGMEHPARYRVLFARAFPPTVTGGPRPEPTIGSPSLLLDDRFPAAGGEVFALLVDGIERCVIAGGSTSDDPFTDATAVWVSLHGTVSLWSTLPEFPWPDRRTFVAGLVTSLAHITAPPGSPPA